MEKLPELDKVARILEETLRTIGSFGISKPMCERLQTVVMQLNGNDAIVNASNGLRIAEAALDMVCWDLKLKEDAVNKNDEQVEGGLHEVRYQLDHWLDDVKHEIDHVLRSGMFDNYLWTAYYDKADEISVAILHEIKGRYNNGTSLHQVVVNLVNEVALLFAQGMRPMLPSYGRQRMSEVISGAVDDAIKSVVWIANVGKLGDEIHDEIHKEITEIENVLRNEWVLKGDEGKRLLDGLINYYHLRMIQITRHVISNACQRSHSWINQEIVGPVADTLIYDIFRQIHARGIPFISIQCVEQNVVEGLEQRMCQRLSAAIKDVLMERRTQIKDMLRPVAEECVGQFRDETLEILFELRKQFDCCFGEIRELMCKCIAEQQRVVACARHIRETKVGQLLREIKCIRIEIARLAVLPKTGDVKTPVLSGGAKDKHKMVQLWKGGPYWAETNIGAENPWESGYHFGWGDTVGYKFENGVWVGSDGSAMKWETFGKDISVLRHEGWITADGVLEPEHDAAQVQWGGGWRMPNEQELDELCRKCDWNRKKMNGVNGYFVRGRGDYSSAIIFLPCAGGGYGISFSGADSNGCYWSSVPRSDCYYAGLLYFNSSGHGTGSGYRYYGQSIRPVQGFTK